MIERSQQVLLDALKASLFEIPFLYPDDMDWDDVIKEAKSQTVMGLISPVIPIHDESCDQGRAYYMRLLHEQDKFLKLLDNNNIPCVVLKGCAAAMYYPKPFLRSMGDVDLLVPRNRFDDAMILIESNGYVCVEGKGDDGQPLQGVRHIGYIKNGIEFELHHHFSSKGFNIDDILERAIDKREYKELNGYRFPVLPEIENGLVLLGHIHQHLTLDHLGLRQIIDWEMYYNAVMDNEKWNKEFVPIAKKIGLLELAVNVTKMCEKHLGLSNSIKSNMDNNHEKGVTDQLLEYLLTSGNFGNKQAHLSSKMDSGERIRTVTQEIKNKGLYSYFQDNGLETWKLCRRYPVLKPLAFIYGIFRFFVRGITGIFKTGRLKEQLRYVRNKNRFDKDLGIRTNDYQNIRRHKPEEK